MYPPPPVNPSPVAAKKETHEVKKVVAPPNPVREALMNAVATTAAISSLLCLGGLAPHSNFVSLFSTFTLGIIVGYKIVWGVSPSLHSPLMSVTNAVSGVVLVGGMVVMDGGYVPASFAGCLASLSVAIASLNIFGGFSITQRMLDMFKRPTDPKQHNYMMALPAALFGASYYYMIQNGYNINNTTNMAYLAASVACILSLGGLSHQKTAGIGNALGMLGVGIGTLATLGSLGFSHALLAQWLAMVAIGGTTGFTISK